MKKLTIIAALALSLLACKKNEKKPDFEQPPVHIPNDTLTFLAIRHDNYSVANWTFRLDSLNIRITTEMGRTDTIFLKERYQENVSVAFRNKKVGVFNPTTNTTDSVVSNYKFYVNGLRVKTDTFYLTKDLR